MAEQTYNLDFDGYWREAAWNGIPSQSGIYCIYAGTRDPDNKTVSLRSLLYIGESGDVRSRVPQDPKNRRDKWARKLRHGELLYASFAPISPQGTRQRAEAAMIFRHKPPCNAEYTQHFPYDKTSIVTGGKNEFLNTSFTVG